MGFGHSWGVAYLRLYEAGKHPDRIHLGRPNWARAELEARPHYARDKLAAASMSPLQVWGLSKWTQQVGQRLTGCDINRFEPQIRQYSQDKTTLYIARTFRRHLEEMYRNGEDFMRTCKDVWDADDSSLKGRNDGSCAVPRRGGVFLVRRRWRRAGAVYFWALSPLIRCLTSQR